MLCTIMTAIQEFGIPSFSREMLTTPGHVFRIGRTPLLIEVINEISGLSFDESFKNKEYIELDNELNVPIIGFEDLITNKSSTDRSKDKANLEDLLKIGLS